MGGFDNTPAGVGVGTAGVDKRSDMDDFAVGTGIQVRGGNEQRYRDNRGNAGAGAGAGAGSSAAGSGAGVGSGYTDVVPGSELGSQGNFRFSTPEVAPEDRGIGGAGLAAAGLGATGAGAAAYYAKVKREARLADERAKRVAETKRGILKDRAQAGVDEDRDARARAQNEADRAAKAQAQADAEAKSRAIQAEIDDELKRLKSKTKGADARAGVSKEAFAAGPTVTSETPTKKRTPIKVETPTDMDDFNRMLRESKVGSATTTAAPTENAARLAAQKKAAAIKAADAYLAVHPEEAKKIKARGVAGKVGLGLTLLGLGTAANAATDMTAGQRERLGRDVLEGLITPLGLTPGLAGEGSELYPSKPLSSAERKKNLETFLANASPADKKKYEEAMARQNPGLFDAIKRPSAANRKAVGGQIKTKRMASGGMTSTMSSASKRGDGIASKGKTRCKMY
jgi:hypothetical protein